MFYTASPDRRAEARSGQVVLRLDGKSYRHPFPIEAGGLVAGFCLIDRHVLVPGIEWNTSQFFIMGPWAGHGVGQRAAKAAFDRFPGRWQVMQVPENGTAVRFWRRIVCTYTGGAFEERLVPEPDRGNALRNVMTFTAPGSRV